MSRTKTVVIGALMAAFAAIFQSLPVLLSEVFVLLTMLSAIPIYISSRIKPLSGVLSYFVAASLVFLVSTHEGLFFLCTNGMVGLSLGLCRYYKQKKPIILLISSITLTISLCIMNFGIGVPVFGAAMPVSVIFQPIILLGFSAVYNLFYLTVSDAIYKRIKIIGIS